MKLAIVNQSTLVADADAERIADALAIQLGQVAEAWGLERPHVAFGPNAMADGEHFPLVLLDDADAAGALGYHDVGPDGKPYSRIFARDSIAGLAGVDPESLTGAQPSDVVNRCVAPVASHEGVETLLDEFADEWGEDPNGVLWAWEGCDAVESSTYPVEVDGQQVLVSDYLLPSYFDPATPAGAQVDEMGVLTTGPFTIAADGYAIYQQSGQVAQIFGAELADWRIGQHERAHPGSRTGKRFARAADASAKADDGQSGGADLTAAATEEEVADARDRHPANHPEPEPVGAAVVQDNVTDPDAPSTTFVETGEVLTHDPHARTVAFGGHALLPESQEIVDDAEATVEP